MTMAPWRHLQQEPPISARERAIPIALIAEMVLAAIPARSRVQQNRGLPASQSEHRAPVARLARSRWPGAGAPPRYSILDSSPLISWAVSRTSLPQSSWRRSSWR